MRSLSLLGEHVFFLFLIFHFVGVLDNSYKERREGA